MKVILNKDVPGVGRIYDIKEVNDGFARNFLIPRNLAYAATENRMKSLAHKKAEHDAHRAAQEKKYTAFAEQLTTIRPVISIKVGEKGQAFGSVGARQIIDAFKKENIDIDPEWVLLEEPIKSTGEKTIPIKFPHDVGASLLITIKAESGE